MTKLLTLPEAAECLRVSRATLFRLISWSGSHLVSLTPTRYRDRVPVRVTAGTA
jgi:hypothetical protein